jgi:hypothetical protein
MKGRKPLWEEFSELTLQVWRDHQNFGNLGIHDFPHALLTAQLAEIIAEPIRLREIAWVAGVVHNTDRIFPENEVARKVWEYLVFTWFGPTDSNMIVEAVLQHSKLNRPDDNPITKALKDADRLASAYGSLCLVRTGQSLPTIPTFDLNHIRTPSPGATYFDCKTILDGFNFILEWQDMLRCPKAIELGRMYFGQLRQLVDDIKMHIETTGLVEFNTWLKTQSR